MASKKNVHEHNERARIAKQQQDAMRRKEARSKTLIWGGLGLVMAAIVAVAVVVISNAAEEQEQIQVAAQSPIPEVTENPDQDATHVENLPEPAPDPVTGTALPPMGGQHDPVWQNCGVYTEPVRTPHAVHSLEHGAVWVAYHPETDEAEVAALRDATSNYAYTLVSPFPDLASPVVLTAWGVQLELDTADDERLDVFLAKYVQGEQTPEPGAACSGGVGEPL